VNDKEAKDPSQLDWVSGRSACSLAKVFASLMLQVEADVTARNALRPSNSPYKYLVTENGGSFTVFLEAKETHLSVVFTFDEHAIMVREGNGSPKFEVTLAFTDQGACKLKVNGEERESWQVRRMALEDLFFASY
jgi:hypothetical protein